MIFRDTVLDYGSWNGVSTRLRRKVRGGFVEFPQGIQQNTPQMQRFSFGFVENRSFFDYLSATNSKAAIIPNGRSSPTMERSSRGIEEGSKISARKNPRMCEGFLTELMVWPVENYFLRRHLATALPIPRSPNTATEVGSGTTPEESSDWKVKKIFRFVDPLGFWVGFSKVPV